MNPEEVIAAMIGMPKRRGRPAKVVKIGNKSEFIIIPTEKNHEGSERVSILIQGHSNNLTGADKASKLEDGYEVPVTREQLMEVIQALTKVATKM